jgi:hypothetical protein
VYEPGALGIVERALQNISPEFTGFCTSMSRQSLSNSSYILPVQQARGIQHSGLFSVVFPFDLYQVDACSFFMT